MDANAALMGRPQNKVCLLIPQILSGHSVMWRETRQGRKHTLESIAMDVALDALCGPGLAIKLAT